MSGPRILVLRAPGTNCDRETAFAFERAGADPVSLHVNELLKKPAVLKEMDGLVIPGGFSHGDDLGAGTVLGTRLRTRLLGSLRSLVDRGGIVLGICNGFQVLVKTGLLPDLDRSGEQAIALASNLSHTYVDRWVTLEAAATNAFFEKGERIEVPVAHAEGRYLPKDDATHERLVREGMIALRYVAPDGTRPAPYPFNPNGAFDDVAGVTDATGRVLGLMPHPERHQFPWQSPRFHLDAAMGAATGVPDGLRMFQRVVRGLRSREHAAKA